MIRISLFLFLLIYLASNAAAEVVPVKAEVKQHNGAPAVFIDGKPAFITGFLAGIIAEDKVYKEMAGAGVHVYMDYVSIGNETEGKRNYASADAYFARITALDPDAYFVPRIGVTAPGWWQEKNKDERIKFSDGSFGPQSFASELWKRDMKEDLVEFVKHVRSSPYAGRVLGFLVCSGYTGEWQAWGVWDRQIGDFSKPAEDGFRKWLMAKYKTDDALKAAWKDDSVKLETASIPKPSERRKASMFNFYDPAKDGVRASDFYTYYSDIVADDISYFAKVVKDASDRNILAGFFYGYLNQHGYFQQESQHNAISKLLDCPDIDFFASPACYSVRAPGGNSNFMTMAESLQLHGKLHFNESDIRTFLSPKNDLFGRCGTLEESLAVLKREVGHVLSRGTNLWWFDMTGGWFSDKQILSHLSQYQKAAADSYNRPRQTSAEIAVVFDDKSITSTCPSVLQAHLVVEPVTEWPRVGASQDYYLLADIANPAMPKHKLYVFLNVFNVSDEQITAIHDRLKNDGATALWVYAPGYSGDTLSTERMKKLTGINLVCEASEQSSMIKVDPDHALAKGTAWSAAIGTSHKHGPVFYADDPGVEVVGTLESLNKPGFVVKKMDGWNSIFYASPYLPTQALRAVAEYSGVHIYSRSNDCFYANRGIVTLHSAEAGEKIIKLPQKADVFDLLTGNKVFDDTDTIKVNMKAKDTVLYRIE